MQLSEKQRELLFLYLRGGLRRINVLEGAVRSGKTWASLLLWAMWVAELPPGAQVLMAAKTLTSLKRNCLAPLEEMCEGAFSYSLGKKEGVLLGRRVLLEGDGDARAEGKIRGLTLHGAYCDELSLFDEDFFWMLMGRLSPPGAMLLATTNPGHPQHWLKRRVLDRGEALGVLDVHFALSDNPFLDEGYREALAREYVGVFRERYVLGRWCAAEGAVYPQFAEAPGRFLEAAPGFDFIQVGVDFGGSRSAFAFVACGLRRDYSTLAALCSERHEAKGVHPEKMYRLLEDFLRRVEALYGPVSIVYADSAEQTLINGMRGRIGVPVRGSVKRRIMDRVRATQGLMASGRFCLTGHCATLSDALCTALYDPDRQEDARLDDGTSDIDTLDAFEYAWERYLTGYARYRVDKWEGE